MRMDGRSRPRRILIGIPGLGQRVVRHEYAYNGNGYVTHVYSKHSPTFDAAVDGRVEFEYGPQPNHHERDALCRLEHFTRRRQGVRLRFRGSSHGRESRHHESLDSVLADTTTVMGV